jgi:hypothetical protein
MHGVLQSSILGPLLFLLYINHFPVAINKLSRPILFADDTSLIVTYSNSLSIAAKLNQTCCPLIFQKPIVCNSKQKNTVSTNTILACNNIVISEVSYIKFLGLIIDDSLFWNLHKEIMKKLTSVCYMIKTVKPYMPFS